MTFDGYSTGRHRQSARFAVAVVLSMAVLVSSEDARAAGAPVEEATESQRNDAKDKYTAGTSAFGEGKFDDALERFRESYAIVASPNSHLMIARSLARLGREAEAYDEYASVVDEATEAAKTNKKYEPTARTASNERAEVEAKLGFVVAHYEGTLTVGDREATLGQRVAVPPGKVQVVLKQASGETSTSEVEVIAGQDTEVRFSPKAGETPASAPCPAATPVAEAAPASGIDQGTLGWIFGGIGVAGFATFGVFGLLDQSRFDDLESQCNGSVCPPDLAQDAETGRTYQTFANIGLGVGIAGVGTGLILLLTAPGSPEAKTGGEPQVSVGLSTVEVSGTF